MNKTLFHAMFSPLRQHLPDSVSHAVRATATAVLTPFHFTHHTGHWLSSLRTKAVSPTGHPIPWYTYPCIDFLAARRGRIRSVLEFGAGQSTLWWAAQGAEVTAFEGDRGWYEALRGQVPGNVDLRYATMSDAAACVADVRAQLAQAGRSRFDAVVVDGLYRTELAALAPSLLSQKGVIICDDSEGYRLLDTIALRVIICDDSEGYRIQETLRDSGLQRVDFFGFSPGVILPHCTSIYFGSTDLFDAAIPIAAATL